ncbi:MULTISPECIES: hypothetical protein [unclassified Schlesneria]|uniref:hypothetical protein n=1 Tax=unclassified Schlesneria TaxID=2762017 RepID=UPI002EF915DB
MLRYLALSIVLVGTWLAADESAEFKLVAPDSWGGETISLPPGFAPDMALQGDEHIRFAPGMMKASSDTFFTYAFVFELEKTPELKDDLIKDEFLKYYRGLCTAVLNGARPDVDPEKFTFDLEKEEQDANKNQDGSFPSGTHLYQGKLTWVEPFATRAPQTLNLEIQTWTSGERNYLFACVSPQTRKAKIWKELHKIRDTYLKDHHKSRD